MRKSQTAKFDTLLRSNYPKIKNMQKKIIQKLTLNKKIKSLSKKAVDFFCRSGRIWLILLINFTSRCS